MVDRRELEEIVTRKCSPDDGRSTLVSLTRKGEKVFDKAFPAHVEHLRGALGKVCIKELSMLKRDSEL